MSRVTKRAPRAARSRHVEALLDDALRMTFPASDPIAPAVLSQPVAAAPRVRKAGKDNPLHAPRRGGGVKSTK